MLLDIWHMDDGRNRISISYDDQFDAPSVSMAVEGHCMRTSALTISDIRGLMACAESFPANSGKWMASAEDSDWSATGTDEGLMFACIDRNGGLTKMEVPWEHAVSMGIALEKQWGER